MANFVEFCQSIGLSTRETKVLTALIKQGPLTMVECARLTGIPRTEVYRLTESLENRQLAKRIIDEHRQLIQAEPIERLKSKFDIEVKKINQIQTALPDILSSLIPTNNPSPTGVKYYRGTEGVSQLVWHITQCQSLEVNGYTFRDLAQVVGPTFAEEIYLEFIRRQVHIKDIYSDNYIESKGGNTNGMKPSINHPDWQRLVTSRYMPNNQLPISHQLDIYDDTVAFYNWHDGEIFGVEIENEKVAHFQRALFNIVWNLIDHP